MNGFGVEDLAVGMGVVGLRIGAGTEGALVLLWATNSVFRFFSLSKASKLAAISAKL